MPAPEDYLDLIGKILEEHEYHKHTYLKKKKAETRLGIYFRQGEAGGVSPRPLQEEGVLYCITGARGVRQHTCHGS